MYKFIYFLFLFQFLFQTGYSQIEAIGSEEFGRIFDLTYDGIVEDRVYAVTLGNHIIVSDDNGENWEILYSLPNGYLENLKYIESLNALAFQSKFTSQAQIYVLDLATQEITKTYTLPSQSGENEWVSDYSIWDQDTNYIFALQGFKIGLSNYAKAQYSSDGGANWSEVYYTVNNLNIFPEKVLIHPDNNQKLLMTLGNGDTDTDGGLWFSDDAGQNWEDKIPGIVLDPMEVNPANTDEIYAGTGISFGGNPENLYRSVDGGETWNIIPLTWTDYLLDNIISIKINPNNPDHILVLEDNEMVISNDGGATWETFVYENAADEIENYYYGLNASFNPFDENEVLISANYYPFRSLDKGETMSRIKSKYFVCDGNVNLFVGESSDQLYYGAQFGFAHRDMNSGVENHHNIMPLNFVSNNPGTTLKLDPNVEGRVFTFSGGFMGSTLSLSINHGENPISLFTDFVNSFDALDSFIGTENTVLASFSSFGENIQLKKIDFSDLGNIQTTDLNKPETIGAITNILIDESNENRILIAQGARIYTSTDGGTTWSETSTGLESLGFDSDLIVKLDQNPFNAQELIIATSGGIFKSIDFGANWTLVNPDFAHNVAFSTEVDGQIVGALHNSQISEFGLYSSIDGGETWDFISNDDLFEIRSNHVFTSTAFRFHEDSADVYIGSSDLGLVKYVLDLETLSVGEPEFISQNQTRIYPNPAQNEIHLASKSTIEKVEIYAMTGQKLITSHALSIPISQLNKGIYIVKIQLENGKTETHKLIKN